MSDSEKKHTFGFAKDTLARENSKFFGFLLTYSYLCTMDRDTFEKQKPFAGEKKPSMLRRCVGHDYTSRQMYMVTMVTEGRRPLFGEPGTGSLVYQKKQVFIAFFLCDFCIYFFFCSFF